MKQIRENYLYICAVLTNTATGFVPIGFNEL